METKDKGLMKRDSFSRNSSVQDSELLLLPSQREEMPRKKGLMGGKKEEKRLKRKTRERN